MRPDRYTLLRLKNRIDCARNWDAGLVAQPSDRAKHLFLERLARERGHQIFIESGTFLGDTAMHMAAHCESVLTVELDPDFYARAERRFARMPWVTVVRGDSIEKIPELVRAAAHPPLVWLDGHYSGGGTACGEEAEPAVRILRALESVAAGTTIVVDDLRMFGRGRGAPELAELVNAAAAITPRLQTGPDCLIALA